MREWGDGERTAVLVHGLTNDASTWWAVGPALAERGYHVYAVELPGHGSTPAPPTWSADALVRAVLDQAPPAPDLAVGHSLGGYTLARALPQLAPKAAVYEDPALTLSGIPEVLAPYRAQKGWSRADVAAAYPLWPAEAHEHKWHALQRWDTTILDALGDPSAFPAAEVRPATGRSLFVLADPSALVPPARAEELRALGHEVTTVEGAGHVVHNDRLDGFLAALEPVLAAS